MFPIASTLEMLDGDWKIRNVITGNLNVGKHLRDLATETAGADGDPLPKILARFAALAESGLA
ncbi:hypothetical protein OHA84_01415 [Streptomyces sp. NBC_00513]|uniref:hypothetical protein n=1 Tax=unclassified Streptomyces TaxID=2593676 RepID=UPI0022559363|nr:hypothetical protein [Streptomyces sp. NBC_00424]MCX5079362.1 hypothetical protein [Streptomyces sp. NBC_00424]WUD39264.1 hypothetical protein OHA84_01415 [Streptomyces sp. NBC_00513]